MMTTKSLTLVFTFLLHASGTISINFTIKNNCPYTIWPGILTGSGPAFPSTGFTLDTGASATLNAPPSWSGRIWVRTQCHNDPTTSKFTCKTGDCASGQVSCNGLGGVPPATLTEFTLNGDSSMDFYDVSLVDGFNLPVSVTPTSGQTQGCSTTACPTDMNKVCPTELAIKDDQSGGVIACKSACLAFNKPEYCCTGAYDSPHTCTPTSYSQIFKTSCPQAYSYAYDDRTSTFHCPSGSTDYLITFCP